MQACFDAARHSSSVQQTRLTKRLQYVGENLAGGRIFSKTSGASERSIFDLIRSVAGAVLALPRRECQGDLPFSFWRVRQSGHWNGAIRPSTDG